MFVLGQVKTRSRGSPGRSPRRGTTPALREPVLEAAKTWRRGFPGRSAPAGGKAPALPELVLEVAKMQSGAVWPWHWGATLDPRPMTLDP